MWIIWSFRICCFSDYHTGLVVDPNFTIYFANANVDPGKLHQVYSNIVWVPQFAGPAQEQPAGGGRGGEGVGLAEGHAERVEISVLERRAMFIRQLLPPR